jgi:hypothetical protein
MEAAKSFLPGCNGLKKNRARVIRALFPGFKESQK